EFAAPRAKHAIYLRIRGTMRRAAGIVAKAVGGNHMSMTIARRAICLLIVSMLSIAGTMRRSEAASAGEIEADVNATLKRFYRQVRGSDDLANRAAGNL